MTAFVFRAVLDTKKKNPIRKFTAAHHCITLTNNSNELLDDIMDEILVSVISLIVCT